MPPFLTLALGGGGGQFYAPATLPLGIQPLVSIISEAGCTPEPGWILDRGEKFLVPAGN